MSTTSSPVRASCGFRLIPTSSLIDFKELDYVAVIGGLLYRGRSLDEPTQSYLKCAAAAGLGLIGICTGSFVLCRLGLMRGKSCCVSWYHYRDFVEEFQGLLPRADELYSVDGNRITSSGGIGAALAAARIVERHLGQSAAQKALHIMQISNHNAVLRPEPPFAGPIDNEHVERALLLMEQNIADPLSIAEIASRLMLSRRSVERHFQNHLQLTPHTAYIDLRLRHARRMLHTRRSMVEIARETGFSNSRRLCAAYRRAHGQSLTEEQRRLHPRAACRVALDCPPEERRVFSVEYEESADLNGD
jgi:transcriptional regulator GlxA family with amidase domain